MWTVEMDDSPLDDDSVAVARLPAADREVLIAATLFFGTVQLPAVV
jgi:hypothetical protein